MRSRGGANRSLPCSRRGRRTQGRLPGSCARHQPGRASRPGSLGERTHRTRLVRESLPATARIGDGPVAHDQPGFLLGGRLRSARNRRGPRVCHTRAQQRRHRYAPACRSPSTGSWTAREIDRLPTAHRLRCANLFGDGTRVVVNTPLTGATAEPPDYFGRTPVVYYRPGEWQRQASGVLKWYENLGSRRR